MSFEQALATAMSFEQALATQAPWLRLWVLWMGVVIVACVAVLLLSRTTRRDAVIILLSNLVVFASMLWFYRQVGFVRLLGLVHVLLWTPLAGYLYLRLKTPILRKPVIASPYRQVIWLLLATIIVSLAFDYSDVARYLLGERASMVK